MKIQGIVRQNAGCDWLRVVLPMIRLQETGCLHQLEMLWIAQDEWEINCDVLWYNKLIATPIQTLLDLKKQGMKIVVDIDDYWVLPPNHINSEWNRSGNDIITAEHIKIADLVICTTERLEKKVKELNTKTIIIPNALPFGQQGYCPAVREPQQKVSFLYAGGVNHLEDIKLLEGKFRRIGSDSWYRDNTEFILAGYEKATLRRYNSKQDMEQQNGNYKLETTRGPYDDMLNIFSYTGSYKKIDTKPVQDYISCYDQADVCLAPLTDTSWNNMKSELKVLEAASRSIPVIASNVPPYSDLRPCEGIMYLEGKDDLLYYIKKCVKEPEWRKEMGKKLAEWVSDEYDLDKWNLTRIQAMESL